MGKRSKGVKMWAVLRQNEIVAIFPERMTARVYADDWTDCEKQIHVVKAVLVFVPVVKAKKPAKKKGAKKQ